ncbi:hypothetical protein OAF65_02295, partial [Verrucomicrobiales bacterium]|nr:hypothetical protein [Verrucomicrobiales bacterium]
MILLIIIYTFVFVDLINKTFNDKSLLLRILSFFVLSLFVQSIIVPEIWNNNYDGLAVDIQTYRLYVIPLFFILYLLFIMNLKIIRKQRITISNISETKFYVLLIAYLLQPY